MFYDNNLDKYYLKLKKAADAVQSRQPWCNQKTFLSAVEFDYSLLKYIPDKFLKSSLSQGNKRNHLLQEDGVLPHSPNCSRKIKNL